MSDVIKKIKKDINKRIQNYEHTKDQHRKDIEELEKKVIDKKAKLALVQMHINSAKTELEDIEKFLKWSER